MSARDRERVALELARLRRSLFPNLICALVFEATYQKLKLQLPELERATFMQAVHDLDVEVSSS